MKKIWTLGLIGIALVAVLVGGAVALPSQACARPGDTAPAGRVLCCCRTSMGGSCCAYVFICSGGFVMGCLCAN